MSYIHHTNDYRHICRGFYSSTLQIGSVPRLRFCWRPWRFKINFRVNFMSMKKSKNCSRKLDVQKASVSHSSRNQRLFHWMLVCEWTVSLLLICGMWWTECCIHRTTYNQSKRSLHPKANPEGPRWTAWGTTSITSGWRNKVIETLISCQIFCAKPSCTFFEDNGAVIKIIIKGQKSDDETRIKNPQSRVRLVVWQNQLGPLPKSKSNMLTPKTNWQTSWRKAVSRVMNGAIFFVCLTSWIFLCSLAAIFVQLKRQTPCRREFNKEGWEENLRQQSRGQCVWFQDAWTESNPLLFGVDASNVPGNPQLYSGSVERLQRSRNPHPETCFQVWKGDNQSQRCCGKPQRGTAQGAMLDISRVAGNCNGT